MEKKGRRKERKEEREGYERRETEEAEGRERCNIRSNLGCAFEPIKTSAAKRAGPTMINTRESFLLISTAIAIAIMNISGERTSILRAIIIAF